MSELEDVSGIQFTELPAQGLLLLLFDQLYKHG
jgi:hypothetical protein